MKILISVMISGRDGATSPSEHNNIVNLVRSCLNSALWLWTLVKPYFSRSIAQSVPESFAVDCGRNGI